MHRKGKVLKNLSVQNRPAYRHKRRSNENMTRGDRWIRTISVRVKVSCAAITPYPSYYAHKPTPATRQISTTDMP